jgi:nucleoside-diphosphate-sugar epimerase
MNKKILLVGGCGFIGHNLALYLKKEGCSVSIVDSLSVNNVLSFTDSDIKSDVWTINHGLGKFPSVTVVDSANTVVVGNVDYTSSQSLVITFNAAFSGCVFLN